MGYIVNRKKTGKIGWNTFCTKLRFKEVPSSHGCVKPLLCLVSPPFYPEDTQWLHLCCKVWRQADEYVKEITSQTGHAIDSFLHEILMHLSHEMKRPKLCYLPSSHVMMGRLSFSWLKAQYFHLAASSAFLSTWPGTTAQCYTCWNTCTRVSPHDTCYHDATT